MRLSELILPREKIFFQLLEQESRNVLVGAQNLRELIETYDNLEQRRNRIKEIEREGDDIVHEIYEQLRKTFVTPIDREQIGQLASLYDDVLDLIYGVVNRLYLYEIKRPTAVMHQFADLVFKSVREIDIAFATIHEITAPSIEARCNEVNRLENEADILLNESVAALFKSYDAITLIKLKEIYEILESITDKCEDVAQIIRDIIVEYS